MIIVARKENIVHENHNDEKEVYRGMFRLAFSGFWLFCYS